MTRSLLLPLVLLVGCPESDKPSDETGNPGETGETGETGGSDCTDTAGTSYKDADGDGYGAGDAGGLCDDSAANWVAVAGDCDDTNIDINPDTLETCNDLDDNCDGSIDEGLEQTWYADTDEDGFGDPGATTLSCHTPPGTATNGDDCNDADSAVNPSGTEVCSGVDEDCDGVNDADQTASYTSTDGTVVDVTAPLMAGTPDAPAYIGDQSGYQLEVSTGTVSLCAGTWYTKIVLAGLGSELSVVGIDGAGATTLTTGGTGGGDDGSVIAVTGASLTVRGVTITGGIGSEGNTKGGGVAVTQSGSLATTPNVVFYDSIITGNATSYGGGIALLDYASVALHDTWVTENSAEEAGGGVWVQDNGVLTCETNTIGGGGFTLNEAPIAGGFYFSSKTNGLLTSTGCDWGDAGTDDNALNDIQRQPHFDNAWCFGNAAALTDSVVCDSTGCTGTQTATCE